MEMERMHCNVQNNGMKGENEREGKEMQQYAQGCCTGTSTH